MRALSELTDGFEPHDHIYTAGLPVHPCSQLCTTRREGRGVPGVVGSWVGAREGYTGTQVQTLRTHDLRVWTLRLAYPRPNEGNYWPSEHVIGLRASNCSRIDPEWTQN